MDDCLGQIPFGKVSLDLLTERSGDVAQLGPNVGRIMTFCVADYLSPQFRRKAGIPGFGGYDSHTLHCVVGRIKDEKWEDELQRLGSGLIWRC